jgi:hypothetical protein
LMMHFEFHWSHWQVVVNAVKESHENHLGVTLSAVTRSEFN